MGYCKNSKHPSVTQVLSLWTNFDAVPEHVLAAASGRGTEVHHACACVIQGLWFPPVSLEASLYVHSFRAWASIIEDVSLSELELVDEAYGFCGHPDFIGRLRGDEGLTIIDWKTPLAKSKTWRLQLAAYKRLAEANGHKISRVASLRLRKDGGPAILDEYTGMASQDLAVFLACLTAYKFFNGGK